MSMSGQKRSLFVIATAPVLRGPAGRLCFEGLFAAHVNFDLLGLGFGLLGEVDFQHALVVVSAHLLRVHGTGQSERAGEASVLPLDADGSSPLFLLSRFCVRRGRSPSYNATTVTSEWPVIRPESSRMTPLSESLPRRGLCHFSSRKRLPFGA